MDRRESAPQENGFLKDLNTDEAEYDDMVEYNGKKYRVPYKIIKEVTFSGLNPSDLKDIEHSARLQYRLLLLDSVLKAKVEFIRSRIIITYNPPESMNRKDKISRQQLIEFLSKEGVGVNPGSIAERDVDYFEEIYKYQFEPASIREHAPYGYSREQWKQMKPEWDRKQKEVAQAKYTKFLKFQDSYIDQHPELLGIGTKRNFAEQPKKLTLKDRIMGKGKKEKDKGFWFHGV
jgi:hypothetical protein